MNNKKTNKNKKIEDSTKYGEFVASFFNWNTLEGQKKKAKQLEDMTKNK